MTLHPFAVGIDISKDKLDLHDTSSGKTWQIPNTKEAISALLVEWSTLDQSPLILFEATGSYDRALCLGLKGAGLRYARVNPTRARDFARAAGFLAKTDRLDAIMLARMALSLQPETEQPRSAEEDALTGLMRRRDQLVAMRSQERIRLKNVCDPVIEADLKAHIDWLSDRLDTLQTEIDAVIRASAALKARITLMQTLPGIGAVTATILAAMMPELGRRSPKAIAALAGLAPFNADSGQKRGKRTIRGGRKRVRDALYMCAVVAMRHNPRCKAFYTRLREAGKPAKLAIIAVARKLLITLNAMLRDNKSFDL